MSGITCARCNCDINGPITCTKKCDCNAHDKKFEGAYAFKVG